MAGCRKDGRLRFESRRSKLRPAARQGQDLLEAQAYICQAHAIFEGLSKAEGLGQVRLQVRTAFQYFVPNACICTAAVSKAALQIVSSPSSDHLLRCTDSSYLQKLLAETGAKHRQLKTGGDLSADLFLPTTTIDKHDRQLKRQPLSSSGRGLCCSIEASARVWAKGDNSAGAPMDAGCY